MEEQRPHDTSKIRAVYRQQDVLMAAEFWQKNDSGSAR
jgi:hypothetical protein